MAQQTLRNDVPIKLSLRSVLTRFAIYLALLLCFVWLVVTFAEQVPSKQIVFWGSFALFIFLAIGVLSESKKLISATKDWSVARRGDDFSGEQDGFISMPIMLIGAFISMCVFGFHQYGDKFIVVENPTTATWMLYACDNVIRAAFFDLAEVFYIDLSNVEHAPSFFACSIVLFFRLVLASSFLSVLIGGYRLIMEEGADAWRENSGKVIIECSPEIAWQLVTDTENIHYLNVPRFHSAIDRDAACVGTTFEAWSQFSSGSEDSRYTRYVTEWEPNRLFGFGWDPARTRTRFEIDELSNGTIEFTYTILGRRSLRDRIFFDPEKADPHWVGQIKTTLANVKRKAEEQASTQVAG